MYLVFTYNLSRGERFASFETVHIVCLVCASRCIWCFGSYSDWCIVVVALCRVVDGAELLLQVMATWLSVCLSRWCIVPKRLSRSSCDFHQIVAQPFEFFCTEYEPGSSRGSSSLRASNGMAEVRNVENMTCVTAVLTTSLSNAWDANYGGWWFCIKCGVCLTVARLSVTPVTVLTHSPYDAVRCDHFKITLGTW